MFRLYALVILRAIATENDVTTKKKKSIIIIINFCFQDCSTQPRTMERSRRGHQDAGQGVCHRQHPTATWDQNNEGYSSQQSGQLRWSLLWFTQCLYSDGVRSQGKSRWYSLNGFSAAGLELQILPPQSESSIVGSTEINSTLYPVHAPKG